MAGKIDSGLLDAFIPGRAEYRRLIESLRVMLASIAALLMLNTYSSPPPLLVVVVLGFGAYAGLVLWMAANGTVNGQHRIFYWLDAAWLLSLLALAGEARTMYFLFLFFPVFFAAWRTGYRQSVAIAAFSGLASLGIFAFNHPELPWKQLLSLPLSLLVVGPFLVVLARSEAVTQRSQAFAATVIDSIDPRLGIDNIIPGMVARVATHLQASVALLAMRTLEGKCRVYCWDALEGLSELSESAAQAIVDQALSLTPETSIAWAGGSRWWGFDRQIELGPRGAPAVFHPPNRPILAALSNLIGQKNLLTVPMNSAAVGQMRLILSGAAVEVNLQLLAMLQFMVEQIAPSVENACLRERLATEAAETERAKIGRDLHDSAIQPYIGLKFAVEAVQRRAGPSNPVTPDLARLADMVAGELASLREVVSGLRGATGKGSELLSNALRRQAVRFEQLFGIQVDLAVDGEIPLNRNMAGELFHIIAEGLSNIRRHTQSRRAEISLKMAGDQLVVTIHNDKPPGAPAVQDFVPRSLSERAFDLGGFCEVKRDGSGTAVIVHVPMPAGKLKGEIK